MTPLNVMIVDDSLLTTKLLAKALGELGHTVVRTAKSGREGVEAYGECNPDLVTMDVTMPDMDGLAATKAFVEIYRDARIVMVTSHAQCGMVLDAMDAGAKGYVLTPFQTEKLRAVIDRVMAPALVAS